VNIVLINDAAFIRGGADRVAFDSAYALASLGHRVILFAAFGPVAPELQATRSISVICVGTGWIRQEQTSFGAAMRGIWNRKTAARLRALLAGLDPKETVVHVHLYSSALSASVLDASLRAGFATVLSIHDYFITCPNGAYFVFPRAEICERRALSLSCLACHCDSRKRLHKVWRVARTWLQNRIMRIPGRLTAYVAVSETCAELARRDLPAGSRIEVIPNIVGMERLPPVDVSRNRAFVFSGRLEDYKGPQLLARAAVRLGLPVIFCGAGPLESELRRICPSARFTGWLQPGGVLEELGRARAFVFPSVYRETFGLSAVEALARGIPVVASRGTAAEEFIRHDENGLLFAHNSVDDLAAQLAMLADDKIVGRLGQEAYLKYWEHPLTVEIHVSRLLKFYRSVLVGKHPNAEATAGAASRNAEAPV
jgi:glycosyltransferase involved in cell wall biosynthesis